MNALRRAAPALAALLLAGCEVLQPPQPAPAPVPAPAPAPTESIIVLYQRPPERSLIVGLRYYEDGAFDRAEQNLRSALNQGLRDKRDAAAAHKYLAFIACAFNRIAECEAQFRNAFTADPSFALSDSEIGHPIWGPVYRRVAARLKK